jgi:hypothetical protein
MPFPAPTNARFTVSAENVSFFGQTAIGFTTSPSAARNFETSGQVWLEVDTRGYYPAYDPVEHVASAVLDGVQVASVPYQAQAIRYAGVEGSMYANVDNFTLAAGPAT